MHTNIAKKTNMAFISLAVGAALMLAIFQLGAVNAKAEATEGGAERWLYWWPILVYFTF